MTRKRFWNQNLHGELGFSPTRLYVHRILLRGPNVGPIIKQEDDINIDLRETGCEDGRGVAKGV
jgi:hypothetical protein